MKVAAALYWFRWIDPVDVRSQFKSVYRFLLNKWWFDELYDWLFVRPTHVISKLAANIDRLRRVRESPGSDKRFRQDRSNRQ